MENGRIKVWLPAIRAGSGADVFTRRLAQALERHDIVAHITWFTKYDELMPLRLMQAVPPPGTDIVLANSWSGYAFKRARLPLIVTVHHAIFEPELDVYKSCGQRLYHRYVAEPRELRSLRAADAVTAVSAYVADRIRARYGIEEIEVIYNWVDTDKFCPAQQLDREQGMFRLLFVGKTTRLKGADLLAPIMRMLGPDFELRVTATEEECRLLNFPSNVYPVGRLSEDSLIRAYQECDSVLLPSRAEGFGYAALEAMACGKPVIASNNTALPEIVADGFTGILCNINDVEAFAVACRLLADDSRLLSMGSAGRKCAVQQFSWSTVAANYCTLIQRLVVY
ncbi:MAG TPA: glycosyltransferase family 4 protein [Novimethylophilus sp.]|jgi:glycosyltransferase involved in cell wall biosynthesis|uniref:glycosyltransferase family 4 protein n=1 Tax=Novimethylophilus sp. TaxID=2137426 RepID=UPI002F42318B